MLSLSEDDKKERWSKWRYDEEGKTEETQFQRDLTAVNLNIDEKDSVKSGHLTFKRCKEYRHKTYTIY